jgi:hypothetical protein
VGVAVLVTIVGSRVSASSVDDFRLAWSLAAGLALATAALGVQLARTAPAAPPAGQPRPERPLARKE